MAARAYWSALGPARSAIACSGAMYIGVPMLVALLGQVLARVLVEVERDAEVGEHGHAVLGQQDVLGLHVAVHHARAVRVRERLGAASRVIRSASATRQPALALEPLAERLAADVRHGEPEPAVVLARIVDRADVGVLEPRGRRDLAAEALGVHAEADLAAGGA